MSQSTTANFGGFSIKTNKLDESIMKQSKMINSLLENSSFTKPILKDSKSIENHPQLPSETSSIMSKTIGPTR